MKEMAVFQLALAHVNYANICTLRTLMHGLTVFRGGLFSIEHLEDHIIPGPPLC